MAGITPHVAAIRLGRPLPDASRNQPGRLVRKRLGRSPRRPYSVLLPVGFAVPSPLPGPRWALTPPFHPYSPGASRRRPPSRCRRRSPDVRIKTGHRMFPMSAGERSVFCGTFPEVALAGRWPAPSFRGARTFLPGENPGAAARPTGGRHMGRKRRGVKGNKAISR